jgi:hypothetical protein
MSWGILGVMLALPAFAKEGDWKEKEALRDGQTRVWESFKAQEVKNPFTGEISINIVSHQYYEKADGLNYNIGTLKKPQWVPSVERIKATENPYFPYQADEGPYKVKFGVSIDQATPIEYSIGNDTIRLGLKYLAYYDKKNGTLKPFKTLNHVNPVVEGNKVIYKNAFTGIDVEYVYQKGVFQQNIIINSKGNLESPISYGISTDNAYLVAVTELDTTEFSTEFVNTKGEKMAQGLLKGESCDILFKKKGSILCTLAPSLAYADTEKGKKEINQYRHIYQDGNKQYLLEGISCQELGNLSVPLTLDYEIKTGGLSGNEVWKEGKTYYLSGNLTINSGATLVIEPGTICKYSTGKSLTAASGGRLIAKGDKFNYILMTSWNDNQVGETITNSNGTPQPSDYYCPINLPANTVTDHRIEYCKISYSGYGLNIQTGLDYPIQNNIIRNTGCYGIYLANEGLSGSHDVKNNLLVKNGISIAFVCGKDADGQMNIINNTIDQNIIGLYVTGDSFNLNCNIINNLFSSDTYGMYGDYIESHSYNKFYSVATPFHGNVSLGTGEDTTLENPYRASPNGSYYLNQNYNKVINAGTGTSANLGLAEKTTYAPSTAKAGDCPNHWVKINRDMDTVDIGYHYDPVDVVVGTSASDFAINYGTGLIAIDPGVVVSFYRDNTYHSAYFQLSGLGCVSTGGTPSDRVQFTSIYATSDLPTLPKRGGLDTYDYECAIYLNTGSKTVESSIQNCKFQYADEAVFTNISLNIDKAIRDNLFRKNVYGFCITNRMGNVVNNIFDSNQYAIWLFQTDESRQVNYLQSNTFYSNLTAIYAQQSINSQGKLTFRLENNILVGNKMGACGTGVTGGFTAETRNNVYWNNGSNVDGTWVHFNTLGGENSDTAVNPLFSHAARSQNSAWIPTNSDDGFYLAQRSGDASRFPLINDDLDSLNGIDVSGLSNWIAPSIDLPVITVYSVNASNVMTCLGQYWQNDGQGEYCDSDTNEGNILISIQVGNLEFPIEAGDYITLQFSNGSKEKVYLPAMTIGDLKELLVWVAMDGSTYHGLKSHDYSGGYSYTPDQDAWYAMGYDVPNGLAKSAYDGGARSVAVDRGAVKVSNYQSSTYKYTLSVSTGYTNTNKVTQDNISLYRVIPASLPAQTADPLGRLDAGFHYGGSVYFTTDIFNKNTEPSGHYDYYFMNDERRDIGAGEYNANQLTGHQILTYTGVSAGLEEHSWQTPCYHVLNTPVISPIDSNFKIMQNWYYESPYPYSYPPAQEITQIPVTVSPNGTIFCAFVVNYFDTGGDKNFLQSGFSNHYLHIYRYRPDTLDWRLIAQYDTNHILTDPYTFTGIETTFHSLSLAASNDTVWVSWVEKRYSGKIDDLNVTIQTALCAAVVPVDPVTVTHIGVSPNIVNTLVNQLYVFTGRSEQVSLTWDTYIDRLSKPGVRIAYVDIGESSNLAIITGDLSILSNIISLVGPQVINENSKKPSIVFNPNVNTSSYRAYIADNLENGVFYVKAHNLTDDVNETWTADSYFSNIQGDHLDLSYRCTGSKLVAWDKYGCIQMPGLTNGLRLKGAAEYPRIGTDRVNNQDLFISWKDEFDTDGNSTLENVMAASELYP